MQLNLARDVYPRLADARALVEHPRNACLHMEGGRFHFLDRAHGNRLVALALAVAVTVTVTVAVAVAVGAVGAPVYSHQVGAADVRVVVVAKCESREKTVERVSARAWFAPLYSLFCLPLALSSHVVNLPVLRDAAPTRPLSD